MNRFLTKPARPELVEGRACRKAKHGTKRFHLALVLAPFLLAPFAAAHAADRPVSVRPEAGGLVEAEPVADAPAGMRAWRIRYHTRDQNSLPIDATGLVVAPMPEPRPRPRRVLAWTHGAWGVAAKCGPSLSPEFFTATPGLEEMVRRGYVVVAPDYPGLGMSGPGSRGTHGFLVGRETAFSVLDAVRAARAVPGVAAGRNFALWGESQGGHAALWTASEAGRYAPDLSLMGTAAAVPPTDLVANLRQGSDPNARAMLTAFAAYSWSQRFDAPLLTMFNAVNQGVVTRLAQNNCIQLGKTPRIGTILGIVSVRGALKRKDIAATPPWSGIARDNSVIPTRVEGPLFIAQGGKDTVVAPAVTLAFAKRYCRTGRPLRYLRIPRADHAGTARESVMETLDWIDARFAGEALPDDCRRL